MGISTIPAPFSAQEIIPVTPLASFDVAEHKPFVPQFCIAPPHDEICATFPDDQTDFSASFEYRIVSDSAQEPFDFFSWQAFVALNWPMLVPENPAPSLTHFGTARWQHFRRRQAVFGSDIAGQNCGLANDIATIVTDDIMQADGTVLIDQAGNYVVYEIRLNSIAEGYILGNALNRMAGQKALQTPISLPQGRIGPDATAASILVKTAWRILPDPQTSNGYLTAKSVIRIPANRARSGQELCLNLTLGMVGMHIVTRVHSGNGDEWIWSTFEHRDNAPIASNARKINSIYARELFPDGCKAPVQTSETYSFFDPDCPECQANAAPPDTWKWASRPPFAGGNGQITQGTQVVRCWDIFKETRNANQLWQAKLAGTDLENYMLISTQWRGANKSPLFEQGEVPRYLSNVTMETFIQADKSGSCLGCHAGAATAAGQEANFTFIFQDVSQ